MRHHQDVDVLVWGRDVGQARFPRISVMARQLLEVQQLNVCLVCVTLWPPGW
jgi:hypothetical protein